MTTRFLIVSAFLLCLPAQASARPVRGKTDARPAKGWLGVQLAPLTKLDRRQKGVPRYGGVLVVGVLKGTPAWRTGLQPGDVLMRLDNRYVYNPTAVIRKVAARKAGALMKIDIIRNGKWMMARVALAGRPATKRGADAKPARAKAPKRVKTAPKRALAPPTKADPRLRKLEREVRDLRGILQKLKGVCRQVRGTR